MKLELQEAVANKGASVEQARFAASVDPEPVAEEAEDKVAEAQKEATTEPEHEEGAEEPVAAVTKEATPEPDPVADKAKEPVTEVKKEETLEPASDSEKAQVPVAEIKEDATLIKNDESRNDPEDGVLFGEAKKPGPSYLPETTREKEPQGTNAQVPSEVISAKDNITNQKFLLE